ncbi:dihydrofolate reductase family protein [Nonomuraea sp. NPDC055795]
MSEREKQLTKGRVVVVNFMSIDGVIQSPLSPDEDRDGGFAHGGWVVPHSDDTVAGYMRTTTVDAAGMLLGRQSYQILNEAWSSADEVEPAVAAMNRMPKYVVSRSPVSVDWNNSHRVDGDHLPAAVEGLKEQVDGDLVVFGSGALIRALAEHDLVDEYRLLVFPIVIGAGKRMFGDDGHFARFSHTGTTTSPSGVVILTYVRRTDA